MLDFEHGLNSIDLQNINKISIINYIYSSSGVTQQMIAKRLNISMPTVIQNLKELRGKNLLVETTTLESSGGRRPRLIEYNYNSYNSIGIMIRPKKYVIVLLNLKGEVKTSASYKCKFENTSKYWKNINSNANNMINESQMDMKCIIGIGISLPSVIIHNEKRLDMSTTLPSLDYTKFSDIQQYFDLPMRFENEANAAGYAEAWIRRKYNDVVFLSISEGVGGAYITNRGISHGNNGRLGEFGHMVIHKDGKQCACGRKGCFEAYCSTNVLSEYTGGDLEQFWECLNDKDEGAIQIFNEYLRDIAIMVTNLRVSLDCDIIIGGDIRKGLDLCFNKLIQYVDNENKYFENVDYLSISYYDDIGAAIGVAELCAIDFVNS